MSESSNKNKYIWCDFFYVVFIALTISIATSSAKAETNKQQSTFKIGVINPLSGLYENYGQQCQRGYDLAYKELGSDLKAQISLAVEDDQSTPKMAVTALQKLLADPQLLATTAFSSSVALALSSITISNKLPIVAVSAHPDFVNNNPYAYSNWLDASYESKKFFDAFKRDQVKRLALVTFENDYTLAVRTELFKLAKLKNIEIVFDEKISDLSDYRSLLPKLMATNSDAVFINLIGPSFPQFTKQLHEFGFKKAKYSLNSNARSDYLNSIGHTASDGIIYYGPDYYRSFFLKHLDQNSNIAEGYSYTFCCYLGMKLILNSAEKLIKSSALTRANLQLEMSKTKNLNFGSEKIPVINRRLVYDFTESRAKDGKIVHYEP